MLPSLLGSFDAAQYQEVFDTTFTTRTFTDPHYVNYVAAYDYPLSLQFLVDANDEGHPIVQSFAGFQLRDRDDPTAKAVRRTWFDFTRTYQPEAVAWLEQQLKDYLAAPGMITWIDESFGNVCAGFHALLPDSYPGGYPSNLSWFIENAHLSDDFSASAKAHGATDSCRYKQVVAP